MPKTAGRSFAAALEQNFGAAMWRDYAYLPINIPPYERNKAALQNGLYNADRDFQGIECIHGHFLPIKYLLLADRRKISFVAWLRNPVDRILSHYYFWKRRKIDPETAPPLRRKMIEEEWSLERFCLGPELRNLYCQFLYGFPLEYFSFVGITEFYDDDLASFAEHYMRSSVRPERRNVGNPGGDGYRIEESLRKEIERHHSRDIELYHGALENRLQRHPPDRG
jgi:hypothetical protein